MPMAIAPASRRGGRTSRCARRVRASWASRATATRRARAPRSRRRTWRARPRSSPPMRDATASISTARWRARSSAAPRNPCPAPARKSARACSTAPPRSKRCARANNAPAAPLADTRPNMPDHPRKPSKDESQQLLRFLSGRPGDAAERQKAVSAMRWAAEIDDPDVASRLMEWAREGAAIAARGPAPPEIRSALFKLLRRAIGHQGFALTVSDLPRLEAALARQDNETIRSQIGPALRLVIGKPRDEDINNLNAWLNQILKETSMDFFIDTSSIPILQDPATLQAFNNRIANELQARFGLPAADADVKTVPRAAAILGMVVLDGEVDPASSGLPDAMRRAWLESLADMPALDAAGRPTTVQVSAVYLTIATLIQTITSNNSQASQQLAFVARDVI